MFWRLLHLAHNARMQVFFCLTLLAYNWPLPSVVPHAICVMFNPKQKLAQNASMPVFCCLTLLAHSSPLLPVVPHAVCVMLCRLVHLAHDAKMQLTRFCAIEADNSSTFFTSVMPSANSEVLPRQQLPTEVALCHGTLAPRDIQTRVTGTYKCVAEALFAHVARSAPQE